MKKKLGFLILLLCLLLATGAMAEANTRLTLVYKPEGLKLLENNGFAAEVSTDFSAGKTGSPTNEIYTTVTLKIDVDQTNWNKLVTDGGLGDSNLRVQWNLTPPDENYTWVQWGMEYTVPYWEENYNADFDYCSGEELKGLQNKWMGFATYLRQEEKVTFTLEPSIQYMMVRWYKSEDDYKNKTDYVTDIIKLVCVPDSGAQQVIPSYVEEIKAATGDMILSAEPKNYEIKYRVSEGLSTLTTRIKAPESADSCDWKNLDEGNNDKTTTAAVDEEGYITLSTPAGSTKTYHYVLEWKKQDGSLLTTQALVITVSVKGSKPTVADPEKDNNMDAFKALADGTTMDFRLNPLADSLMTVEKNKDGVTGWMNIKLKNTTGIPTVAWTDLEKAAYEIELPVPEGTAKVAALMLPENIFDPIDQEIYEQFMARAWDPDNNGAKSVAGKTSYVLEEGILKNMTPGDNRIAVYAPYITADEDRGQPWVFYFYDENGETDQGLYAIVTVSELGTLHTTDVILEAALPDGAVAYPLLVSSNYTGWKLQTEYNIQSGNQAVQMDLTLLDEDGEAAKLEDQNSNVFYLPYPEGMSYESGATWTLRHYLDDDYTEYELLTVTATEHGLRFETNSLSPFVLLWDTPAEEAPISTAPKTGDNTPLALYAALLAISLAAAVALLRRKAVR